MGICIQHCAQRMMAIDVAVIGAVVGIVLGLRYKVLIGVAHADRFWSIVLMTVELITAVQLGYLAGTVTHAAIAAIFPPWKGGGNSGRNSHTQIM
jgi:hypothetical protein